MSFLLVVLKSFQQRQQAGYVDLTIRIWQLFSRLGELFAFIFGPYPLFSQHSGERGDRQLRNELEEPRTALPPFLLHAATYWQSL